MPERSLVLADWQVQAYKDGRLTQIRIPIRPQPANGSKIDFGELGWEVLEPTGGVSLIKPPVQPGDRVWFKEAWFRNECDPDCAGREDKDECPFNRIGNFCYGYKAQYTTGGHENIKWRSPVTMPRSAARLFGTVKDVGVERVRDISREDAIAAGCGHLCGCGRFMCENCNDTGYDYPPQLDFMECWDTRYPRYPFDTSWCWVIELKKEGAPHA